MILPQSEGLGNTEPPAVHIVYRLASAHFAPPSYLDEQKEDRNTPKDPEAKTQRNRRNMATASGLCRQEVESSLFGLGAPLHSQKLLKTPKTICLYMSNIYYNICYFGN